MYFEQKLNALMHLFKLSNSKLARGINVDPSLISRWKSGERQMSSTSPHIPAIASYFLRLNAYHYQRDYLDQILKQSLGAQDLANEARRIHALSEWLVSSEPLALPELADSSVELTKSSNIIQSIAGLVASTIRSNGALAASSPLNLEEIDAAIVLRGSVQQHEVFEGRPGLRQAALRFLSQVVHSEKQLELLLTSEDDITWMTEDPVFLKQWAFLLRLCLQQGHRITVIHVVNRKSDEIMSALAQWVPLHLTGSIQSFYHPRYSEQEVRKTLFIIKDSVAVVGYHTGVQDPPNLTFYYTDLAAVRQFTRVFSATLAGCRPLFSVFSQRNLRSLLDQLLEIRQRDGIFYNIRQHFTALILTPDILLQLVPETMYQPLSVRQLQAAVSLHVDTFFASLAKSRTIDILPFKVIEQIRMTRTLPLTGASFYKQDALYIKGEQLIRYLQNLIAVLKAEDHYELYFSPGTTELETLEANIALKENHAAIFSTEAAQLNPITIMINESNILQSLSFCFEDIIEQIPPGLRQKPDVIRILESLVAEILARPAN